jgi:methionyl aminopeptidase
MIYYKTKEEVELIRKSSLIVSKTLGEVGKYLKPGVSLLKLDKIAEEFIRDNGARPAFKNYRGFPGTLCLSVNEQVVHGIPTNREVNDTDLVSVDCGAELNGYYCDSAYTYAMANIKQEVEQMCIVTKKSLYMGIEQAVVGNRTGDIGYTIQNYVENLHKYGIVRELVGHGVGKGLHEDPEVPNYGKRGTGAKLAEGLVIAIEPMVNLGTRKVFQLSDGWTIVTADKSPSAHYELMVVVSKEGTERLSTFDFAEETEDNNKDLKPIRVKETVK